MHCFIHYKSLESTVLRVDTLYVQGRREVWRGPEAKYFQNYSIRKNCCKSYLNANKIKLQRINERQEFGVEDIGQYFIYKTHLKYCTAIASPKFRF